MIELELRTQATLETIKDNLARIAHAIEAMAKHTDPKFKSLWELTRREK